MKMARQQISGLQTNLELEELFSQAEERSNPHVMLSRCSVGPPTVQIRQGVNQFSCLV
jgi:hypothetical protein